MCKLQQARRATFPSKIGETIDSLRSFASQHRALLAECALRALDVALDLSNATRSALVLGVRRRPGETRSRLAWEVVEADVVDFADMPASWNANEMLGTIYAQNSSEIYLSSGHSCSCMVFIHDLGGSASITSPIAFRPNELESCRERPWRATLFTFLNNGRVYTQDWRTRRRTVGR